MRVICRDEFCDDDISDELQEFTVDDLNEEFQALADLIGLNNVMRVVYTYGGTNIYVPTFDKIRKEKRNVELMRDFEKGASRQDLGRKYDLSTMQINNIIRKHTGGERKSND